MNFKVTKDGDWWKVNGGLIHGKYYKIVKTLSREGAQEIADARNRLLKKKAGRYN